jgi:restriction system protein
MAVPPFYCFIRPTLEVFSDKKERHRNDAKAETTVLMKLSAADLGETLGSGRRTKAMDRAGWAMAYLSQAGLIESTGQRGYWRVTDRGLAYLKRAPDVIKPSDLEEFSEYVEFKTRRRDDTQDSVSSEDSAKITPGEILDSAFSELTDALAFDLLSKVKEMSPERFEWLVVQLMLRLGYGGGLAESGQALGRSGDGGVDGVINQDKLGLDKVYLQAKRWKDGRVGRPEVMGFVGALSGQGATKGVFITTSAFTEEARAYAKANLGFKISLVDGVELARLMVENDLGVSLVQRYDVKRVDSDFFVEE